MQQSLRQTSNQPLPVMAAMKPLVEGRYVIEKKLAEGGLGEIFLAKDTHIGDRVVMKFIRKEFLKDPSEAGIYLRLLSVEAEALSCIYHPAVPGLRSISSNGSFIAMEYIRGSNLQEIDLEPDQVFSIAMGLSDIFGSIHASGVLHRDVKPANILLMDDLHPIVIDFGCAKLSSSGYQELYGDWPVGTAEFTSPEAIRGGNFTDRRSDLYSMAAVLYTKFSGLAPFQIDPDIAPETAMEVRRTMPYTQLSMMAPDLRQSVCSVIDKAMAYDPDDRFDSIEHFRIALASAWA